MLSLILSILLASHGISMGRAAGEYADVEPLEKDALIEVQISSGRLRGFRTTALPSFSSGRTKRHAYVFKKIPFAEPPLGALRFRRLVKKRRWPGVLDATEYGPACLTNTSMSANPPKLIDEDCIHLNIFADANCFERKTTCPIMFFIHPGGLASNSPTILDDNQIVGKYAIKGLVVVTPAYRTGIFGFIDADEVTPNNLGVDDVIFALKWTSKEIENFGGDPTRVTIVGYSSGATIASLLIAGMSAAVPQFLFRSAIIGSPAFYFEKNANLLKTDLILRKFNCFDMNGIPLNRSTQLDCLREVDGHDLINAQYVVDLEINYTYFNVEPSAEFPAKNYRQLLSEHLRPINLLSLTTRSEFSPTNDGLMDKCRNFTSLFGYTKTATTKNCIRHYQAINISLPIGGIDTDVVHANTFQQSLWNMRKGGVSYRGSFQMKNYERHSNDMFFLIGYHTPKNASLTPAEKLMDAFYPQMICNFIKHGIPNQNWKPMNESGSGYFLLNYEVANSGNITKTPEFHIGLDDPEAIKFWLEEERQIEYGNASQSPKWDSAANISDRNHYTDAEKLYELPMIVGVSITVSEEMLRRKGKQASNAELVRNTTGKLFIVWMPLFVLIGLCGPIFLRLMIRVLSGRSAAKQHNERAKIIDNNLDNYYNTV